MKIQDNFVMLFKAPKSEDESDQFEDTLIKHGFEVKQIKTLDFEYKNLDQLEQKLQQPDSYNGIIFSSPRCVHGTNLALNNTKLHPNWAKKHNYVVGNGTSEIAKQLLNLDCDGKESGNANNLGDVILKNKTKFDLNLPFLFPHGNLKMDLLKNKLQPDNINLDEVCVYDSIINNKIGEEFDKETNNFANIPQIMVFFSPSAFKAAQKILLALDKDVINNIKVIPIGPTTEKDILSNGFNVFGIPNQPTPKDLLEIVIKAS